MLLEALEEEDEGALRNAEAGMIRDAHELWEPEEEEEVEEEDEDGDTYMG